ncbi:MAG: hypothetical protein J6X95_06735, partial [Treponema sp.]|nr:hypothetical protein [Treponema sp.]
IPASDGNYYVRALEWAFSGWFTPKYTDGSTARHSGDLGSDCYRYFKVMPLKWRVLTNSYDVDGTSGNKTGSLLVAENAITGNVKFFDGNIWYTKTQASPDQYKASRIRAYLNGLSYLSGGDYGKYRSVNNTEFESKGFLQTAFSQEAIAAIISTHVDQSAAQAFTTPVRTYNYEDTDDKIFILSSQEWMNDSYGFGDATQKRDANTDGHYTRQRFPTDYAIARKGAIYKYAGWANYFYTRTPWYSSNSKQADYKYIDVIAHNGEVLSGEFVSPHDYEGWTSAESWASVVPALCVNLQ